MKLLIRDAELSEIEDACALWNRAETVRTGTAPTAEVRRDFIESMHQAVAKQGARMLIGCAGTELIAAIYGVPLGNDETKAQVAMLCVEPAYWGSGIGSQMLAALTATLYEQGCRRLRMNVDPSNDRARALYERHGWQHSGETEQVETSDVPELIYRRDLVRADASILDDV